MLNLRLTEGALEPNRPYEFAVPVQHPTDPLALNYWGVQMRDPQDVVLDGNRHIEGYTKPRNILSLDIPEGGRSRA